MMENRQTAYQSSCRVNSCAANFTAPVPRPTPTPSPTPCRKDLMDKINHCSFAMNEANLFLDTHPYDTNALELKNEYGREYQKYKKLYEEKYGPLVANADVKDWSMWVDTSWPWERRAR